MRTHDWQELIKGVMPKQTGCGPVYELPNYLKRKGESFAIADMRHIKVAEPHYHPAEDVEIYLVIQGEGLVVVGGKEQRVEAGDAVVIPPNNAHFTIPNDKLVIAAINIPPLQPENYIKIDSLKSHNGVHFDAEQFLRLTVH